MNKKEAEKLARSFLCDNLRLEYCTARPGGIYGFDPSKEFLFSFGLFEESIRGKYRYLSISKTTGQVKYLGRCGE